MNSARDPLKINHSHINAFSKKKKKKKKQRRRRNKHNPNTH